MKLIPILERFRHNAEAIHSLTQGVDAVQAKWRPSAGEWSILEVINHLYDEEREDFRRRLDLLLHQPEQDWPGIDPAGWVLERGYNQRNFAESIANFMAERERSLVWLGQLENPAWGNSRHHPSAGILTAGDMLTCWLAHDCLHLRQLTQLHWHYATALTGPYRVDYAGGGKRF